MTTAVAVKADLPDLQPREREGRILAAFENALATANATEDVLTHATIVRDASALRAMADAYKVSLETRRKVAESSLLCLRTFGASLNKKFPRHTHAERGEATGAPRVICEHAGFLGKYSEQQCREAMEAIPWEHHLGVHGLRRVLQERDPEYVAQLQAKIDANRRRREEIEEARQRDPEYIRITGVIEEFGGSMNVWETQRAMAVEILRLRAILVDANRL